MAHAGSTFLEHWTQLFVEDADTYGLLQVDMRLMRERARGARAGWHACASGASASAASEWMFLQAISLAENPHACCCFSTVQNRDLAPQIEL